MKRRVRTVLAFAALSLTFAACATSGQEFDVVISKGRIIDLAIGLDTIGDIGIRDGVIAEVSENIPEGRLRPEGMRIDTSGFFIVPGFIDTHAHFRGARESHAEFLNALLAYGITSFRDPSSLPVGGVALRERIRTGELLGPEMRTAGTDIDGPVDAQIPTLGKFARFSTADAARAEVLRQAEQGVDDVKLYMWLAPDVLSAAIEEAHRLGLGAIGHLHRTSWTEAARSGIDGLVHSGAEGPFPHLGFVVLGPMARNVVDTALLLSVIAGADARDPGCYPSDPMVFRGNLERSFHGTRVAWSPDLGGLPVDSRVGAALEEVQRKTFEALGCIVEDAAPDFSGADDIFLTIRGFRNAALYGPLLATHRNQIKPEAIREVEAGLKLTTDDVAQAMTAHSQLLDRVRRFQETYEYILCAVNQIPPFDATLDWPKAIDGVAMDSYVAWMKSA